MSCTRSILGGLIGGVVGGGITAGLCAGSGAVGAKIMEAAGYNYSVEEGAQMGAIGGAILGGSISTLSGALVGCTGDAAVSISAGGGSAIVGSFLATSVVSGLIGYGVLDVAKDLIMDLGRTALAFTIGGGVISVGSAVVLGFCAVPIAGCIAMIANDKTPQNLEKNDMENPAQDAPKTDNLEIQIAQELSASRSMRI